MTKRRNTTMHEECLRAFGADFRREVKSNMKMWQSLDPEAAESRKAAYANVLFMLRDAAKKTGVPLQDIGIEDFDV